MDETQRKKEIALFRYAMIAPVIRENVNVQAEYFRDVSKKEHDVPHIGKRRIKVATLKGWLRQYRREGFDALMPKTRDDKGCPRKIDGTIADVIQQTVQQYPLLSCSAIHRLLIAEGHIGIGELTEATVRKYIRDNMLKEKSHTMPRKKFEKEHVNELWLGDEYHKDLHHGINERPMDKFMEDIKQTAIKRISEEELDTAFQITIHRKVKNDSTVSIGGILYECPTTFIGKKIEIRYPSDKPEELTIYEQDKPLCILKKV